MEIIKTGFRDLFIIKPVIHSDKRGYFLESYNREVFSREGISFTPVQDNESKSSRGIIRGLHYQLKPFDQAKLIRVVEGKIFDVAVDIRKNSDTFGEWFGIGLDSESKEQVLIPRGFAHGFSVISDIAIIQYKCDNIYSPSHERGIAYNDPDLNIKWDTGSVTPLLSEKDSSLPLFKDADNNFL